MPDQRRDDQFDRTGNQTPRQQDQFESGGEDQNAQSGSGRERNDSALDRQRTGGQNDRSSSRQDPSERQEMEPRERSDRTMRGSERDERSDQEGRRQQGSRQPNREDELSGQPRDRDAMSGTGREERNRQQDQTGREGGYGGSRQEPLDGGQ